jgi:chromatin remodeling complex protein RSC6
MQTRSGKSYTAAATSSSMENNKPRVETNVDNGRPNNILTGFMKPMQISNELAKFLGKPVGSKMSRPEDVIDIIIDVIRYITTNKLQDRQNGRIINADEKLRKLLKLGRNDVLTFFNLRSYLRPHYTRQ